MAANQKNQGKPNKPGSQAKRETTKENQSSKLPKDTGKREAGNRQEYEHDNSNSSYTQKKRPPAL